MTNVRRKTFPTSPVQAGLWFASTYGGDPTAYNQPLVLRLPGALEHEHLVAAIELVHGEHVALRTTFEMDVDGEVRQVVHERLNPIVDLRECPNGEEDPEQWTADRIAEVAGTTFDLRDGPLARVRHLRFADRSVLVCNVHHTVFDGMSWKPYLAQLEAAYVARTRGDRWQPFSVRQAIDSYERWHERWRPAGQSKTDPGAARYWREKLANLPVVPPFGQPGELPPRNTTRQLVIDGDQFDRLRVFCAAEGVTTSMFFIALWFVLLHRQANQHDMVLGMPVSVREARDAEVVGHLTNTVVLRHHLEAEATTRDLLGKVKREVLDVLRHRHVPLEAVVADLRADGEYRGGTTDLFNAMITVMPAEARRLDLPEWGVRTWEYTSGGAKYDLALIVDEAPDRYTLILEHASTSEDGEALVGHLVGRLAALIEAMIAEPEVAVRRLDWMSTEERQAVTTAGARRRDAPALGTEVTADLFAAAARKRPDQPAVVDNGVVTTYAALDETVETVARGLAGQGIRDGSPVAVLAHPGIGLVSLVLGILRAGGSYVLLDPEHPPERSSMVLADCGARILVCDPAVDLSGLQPPVGVSTVWSDRTGALIDVAGRPVSGPGGFVGTDRKTPRDTAYIVYTSGSTGRPKGVVITETTLANLVHAQAWMSSGLALRTLQYMSPAFDVFALELVGSLCNGGTLVVPPKSTRSDFEALADLLAVHRVERAFLPYVALRELAGVLRDSGVELPDLREVYVTGERLVINDDLRQMFRRYPNARLINAYGPSEAHWCTADVLPADPADWPTMPSIGIVVPGVDARVLVDGDQLAPFGVEGELCIAGPVVSPGYLNLPEQTERSMVADPCGNQGERMYRTGDVVVLAPDGRLHYRGRSDEQVKIRGYRVEPGEVESALERVLGVEAAAVVARSVGEERQLHAFVQSTAEPLPDWRKRLAQVLPDYLVPRTMTRIDTLPVTPTGKTDRRALESWHETHGSTQSVDSERQDSDQDTWNEATLSGRLGELAELWTEVLGQAPTTSEDDFFLLGGHSLLAARLHRLVRQRLGVEIGLSALLSTPTLRGMADRIAGHGGTTQLAPASLREDACLHDLQVVHRREPADPTVLLTGATGFLGSHLLVELLRTGRRVSCLIRADSERAARDRLERTFEKFALDVSGLDAVTVVLGDLSEPELGLGSEATSLPYAVGEVYHAAAHINFVVPYHTVKRTNVDGLRHLLDFCGKNRTPLRLISTLGVFPPDSTSGLVDETVAPGDPESLGIGYSQSKWVAEHLALRAREAGLPVTVHRVGRIGGHSGTGACRHDDFFWLQMKSFAVLGCYPEDMVAAPPVDLLPVDYVAAAIVQLSSGRPDNENWHLYHPDGLAWDTIIETIRAEGYELQPVARTQWMAALERQAESDSQGEGLGSLVPFMREGVMRLANHTFDNEKTARALGELRIAVPPRDPGWIRRMFGYFRAVGSVSRPAVKREGDHHV